MYPHILTHEDTIVKKPYMCAMFVLNIMVVNVAVNDTNMLEEEVRGQAQG